MLFPLYGWLAEHLWTGHFEENYSFYGESAHMVLVLKELPV